MNLNGKEASNEAIVSPLKFQILNFGWIGWQDHQPGIGHVIMHQQLAQKTGGR